MSTSASVSEGVSYQTAHTYFFVPSDFGSSQISANDDTNTPGAILRLGGYSDLEAAASDSDLDKFYPAQYRTDINSDSQVNTASSPTLEKDVFYAAGSGGEASSTDPNTNVTTYANTSKGILLSAAGNILIRSGEKTYVQSVGAMDVDVDDALTITVDDQVTVKSGLAITLETGRASGITYSTDDQGAVTDKNIYISADAGNADLEEVSNNSQRKCFGTSTDVVTSDKYTYFQADEFKIQMGRINQIILGGKFHIWIGATISIRAAIDTQIDLLGKFKYWTLKFDFGLFKFDFYMKKIEFKEGKVSVGAWTLKKKVAEVKQDEIQWSINPLHGDADIIRTVQAAIGTMQAGVESNSKGVKSETNGVTSYM
mgnify:CR=1 FL=1